MSRACEPTKLIPEKIRAVTSQLSELKLLVDEEFLKDLETLRALTSNQMAGASINDVLNFAIQKPIQIQTPKKPKSVTLQKIAAEV